MRLKIVAAAIVVATVVAALMASTVTVQAFALPQKMPSIAGDYGQMPSRSDNSAGNYDINDGNHLFKGLTSVDYLGKVRDLTGTGGLSSMFPWTWLAGGSPGVAGDKAEYLGFTYVRSAAPPPSSSVFYSGERHDGRQIYVSPDDPGRPGMPGHIYLRNGYGFDTYDLSGEPPVYAYVLYGAFNANESVRFGVVNRGGSSLELMNAAPFEIQRKEGGSWRTIFSPMAAQVITPLYNGTAKEWQWDQRLDDDQGAPFGDYRVLIDGKYAASFRLASDTPVVQRTNADYDRFTVSSGVDTSVVPQAFEKAYPSPAAETRGDIVSIMLFKAGVLGLNPDSLRKAIDATGSSSLPCMAIYARFEGRPAWIIAYSSGASVMSGPGVYAVDEASGNVVQQP